MQQKLRTKDQIAQEYTQHAAALGDKAFSLGRIQADMESLKISMRTLIEENAAMEETEKKVATALAEAKATEIAKDALAAANSLDKPCA